MESADRTASNSDKCERKNASGKHWTSSVNEAGEWRHVQRGPDGQNSQRKKTDGSELDEGAEIIAWRQQKPHRQSGCRETVDHEDDGKRRRAQGKPAGDAGSLRDPLPAPNRQHDKNES